MRKYLIALAASAMLPACATMPLAPADVANATVLDEKAAIAAEAGYTATSILGNRLSRLGIIPRPAFQALDAKGYAAIQAVRIAYNASNATSYAKALEDAKAATVAIGELVK